MGKVRHVPERMCLGCRAKRPKRELVRVVRTPAGEVLIDPTGKRSGRGAYVCPQEECLRKAIKHKALERALTVSVGTE
ncbi:MAG: YlxR family protein, partial [Clostridia bacterium]|nr:YlxR family protein [Clostridia bacterium]